MAGYRPAPTKILQKSMPRRKPKHLYGPGQSGNPAGRPIGSSNKVVIAERVREAFSQLLDNNIDQLEGWLHALAKKNPEKALDIWVRISERFVPSLQRTDHHIESNFQMPINILMPNPTIHLSSPEQRLVIGEGTPAMIRESYTLPSEQTSQSLKIGEGAPTENIPNGEITELVSISGEGTPSTDVNGAFSLTIPAFAPTERMLRETGEDLRESPGEALTNS